MILVQNRQRHNAKGDDKNLIFYIRTKNIKMFSRREKEIIMRVSYHDVSAEMQDVN